MTQKSSPIKGLQSLEITLGEERLSPYDFEGFRVGPITAKVTVDEDESPVEVIKRVKDALQPAWDELFLTMRDKFHEHRANKG